MNPSNWRLRWAVRGVLTLGLLASVMANILHARPDMTARVISAWSPFALLLCIEVIARVPATRAWISAVRLFSAAIIGGIAAWVSYWHMVAVAASYGETGATPYLLPLTVDMLVVVASVTLVELGGRRVAGSAVPVVQTAAPEPATTVTPRQPIPQVAAPVDALPTASDTDADEQRRTALTDDQIIRDLRNPRRRPAVVSQRWVMDSYGIGAARAKRVMTAAGLADTEPAERVNGTPQMSAVGAAEGSN